MFNIGDMIDQATELLSSAGVDQASDALNVGQLLADAGLDPDALAQLAPDEIASALESAGLDPEMLNNLESGAFSTPCSVATRRSSLSVKNCAARGVFARGAPRESEK